jgi:AcrR family transcriptional regulator
MPRTARNGKEIEKIRNEILNHALDIIGKEGYDNVSMRYLG